MANTESSKRQCLDPSECRLSMGDIEDLIKKSQQGLVSNIQANVLENVNSVIKTIQSANIQRFDILENKVEAIIQDVQELKQSKSVLENELKDAKTQISELQKRLAVPAGPPKVSPPISSTWDREARADTLSIGTQDFVSKDSLLNVVKLWISSRTNILEDQFLLSGPPMGRNFSLQFHSNEDDPDTGRLRADMANLSLRKEDGKWDKLYVKGPENEDLELFISKDKSPKANRELTLTKRLKKAIDKIQGQNEAIYVHNISATIKHKKSQIARVRCQSFEKFDVEWIASNITDLKINKAEILKEFNSHVGIAPNHAWAI